MRILYGVVGEGMGGHATRSSVVLEHLFATGHEVEIVASGRAAGCPRRRQPATHGARQQAASPHARSARAPSKSRPRRSGSGRSGGGASRARRVHFEREHPLIAHARRQGVPTVALPRSGSSVVEVEGVVCALYAAAPGTQLPNGSLGSAEATAAAACLACQRRDRLGSGGVQCVGPFAMATARPR